MWMGWIIFAMMGVGGAVSYLHHSGNIPKVKELFAKRTNK